MMRRFILMVWILTVAAASGRAGETNETVAVPAANPVADSNNALALLAMVASARTLTLAPVVATNKPVWDGSASLGLTATAGNSDSALVTGNFRAHRKTARDEWTLGADAAYGEANSSKNSESLHGYVQYDHLFTRRWFGYANADALHDAVADVTYRITISPGAGYYFIRQTETTLAVETGPAVLNEKLDDEYHTYPVMRFAERFTHKFDGHARLWQTLEILPPVNRPREFLVNAEIGVETPLTKTLNLQVYLQDNYANRPAPGFKDNDVKLITALAIKF